MKPYEFEIKTDPKYLAAAVSGEKPFTVRKNDRPYKAGSIIRKVAYTPENGFTGDFADFEITYILTYTEFPQGIKEGYIVLGIKKIETEENDEKAN